MTTQKENGIFFGHHILRNSRPEVFYRKHSEKILKIQRKTPVLEFEADSNTGLLIKILGNFKNNLFYRTPLVTTSVPCTNRIRQYAGR